MYAGRFYEAIFDADSQLMKGSVFGLYLDLGTTMAATRYTDATRTTLATSQLATDSYGNLEFYADPGNYYLKSLASGLVNYIQVYEDIRDTANEDDINTAVATYVWHQSVPASTWTIAHSLNKYPSVTVTDNSGNVVMPDVNYQSANTVLVTASSAFVGVAYLN